MKIKNKLLNLSLLMIIISIMFLNILVVKADEQARIGNTTDNQGALLRKGPGTNYNSILTVPYNGLVTVLQKNITSEKGCDNSNWSKVNYNGTEGYVCAKFLVTVSESTTPTPSTPTMSDAEFEQYLTNQGFDETYKVPLRALHKSHPTWTFVGIKTKYSWSNAISQENVAKRSLYQATSNAAQGFLSTDDAYYNWYTNTFKKMEGSTWYQASTQAIAYYMDPRNFLNESGIFMFEKLGYDPSYQTSTVVKNILTSSYYTNLIQYFMDAGRDAKVSPVYLAAKARQEVGLNGGPATNGQGGTYCGNSAWNGFYNFYAIEASSGVCDGIRYAANQGWSSQEIAIKKGAAWISNGYITANQDTTYFQKWNTSIKATKAIYHQYAVDIRYASNTASTTKTGYSKAGLLELPFIFEIPIYSGMPASTSKPKEGNPNNYLKSLTVNDASVSNFDGANTSYTVTVPSTMNSVKIAATTVVSGIKVTGTATQNIVVTAQNGNTRTYTVKIVKSKPVVDGSGNTDVTYLTPDQTITAAGYKINSSTYVYNVTLGSTVAGSIVKLQTANPYASINITNSSNASKTSGSLVTGDKIIIACNGLSKTYTVVIYGDLNGDGEINVVDLGKVQKHLLKTSTLTGAYLKAADTDKNGSINVVDLGKVQKHLLKVSNISQS